MSANSSSRQRWGAKMRSHGLSRFQFSIRHHTDSGRVSVHLGVDNDTLVCLASCADEKAALGKLGLILSRMATIADLSLGFEEFSDHLKVLCAAP
tara:strand:- start:8964 stop:9248 length:285 start_codon:yes stop_codon:yes gene_type:complete